MEKQIKEFLAKRQGEDLERRLIKNSPQGGGKISVAGKTYVNFSSNDYLGLASHPYLFEKAKEASLPCFGSSSSPLMTGRTELHHMLEERIALFKGKEAALIFNSGYQANVGIISAISGGESAVFSDRLNHASIIDGINLSGARLFRFRHNDTEHLERLLETERKKYNGTLIVTESVFSMDGDIAPLKEIASLKEKYNCMLMVDEAHATGIFGEKGSGVVEEKGITEKVDIIMGTFSKALGSFGAYVAASEIIKKYLVNTCRSFIYSTSLPPLVIAANLAALELVEREPFRRRELIYKSCYFRDSLRDNGFCIKGESQIVPIIIGDTKETVHMSECLKQKGYWVTPIRPPTVPQGEARLRISVTFDHSREVLDNFVEDISRFL